MAERVTGTGGRDEAGGDPDATGLRQLLRDDGGRRAVQALPPDALLARVGTALEAGAEDALSVLLHDLGGRSEPERAWLRDRERVVGLVGRAVEARAAACLLMLLNAVRMAEVEVGAAAPTLPDVTLLRLAEARMAQHRSGSVRRGRGFAAEDGGTLRCVRVLLLHCLRQQQYRTFGFRYRVVKGLTSSRYRADTPRGRPQMEETELLVRGGEGATAVCVAWPKTRADYTRHACHIMGCIAGGYDLSDGAAAAAAAVAAAAAAATAAGAAGVGVVGVVVASPSPTVPDHRATTRRP